LIDVGTGSGAIAIALATEGHFSRVYGTDISLDALAVARRNVEALSSLLRAPVELLHGSLLGPLRGVRAGVVVSNPPYIALGEAASLPAGVRDWEPAVALFSGADGMTAITRLVREAADTLAPGGLFALEVDARRASLVTELVSREQRFRAIRVELDLTGRERFVLARRQETDGDDRG
jgi:release factor glutamine methyltransferase